MPASLSETIAVKTVSETSTEGVFEIAGLYTGYGLTLGNALRRILISSLPGAAITRIKIKGVNHEFSTLEGLSEDIVELTLNLKQVRFRLYTDEPQTLTLHVKGEREIFAHDIEGNAQAEVANPDFKVGTLTAKDAELSMELTVERGLGYVPVEANRAEKLPIGVIALDAIFTPVTRVNFVVENMRVHDRTDYNRLKITVSTDGTVTPSVALQSASVILGDHAAKVASLEVRAQEPIEEKKALRQAQGKVKKKK